ncbi:MAG: penicillin acylase family protein [Puniceicoccaceae bacterium]|nr:MAG: penicillin acylase family protein [Puniceicoccaceae bacterium]
MTRRKRPRFLLWLAIASLAVIVVVATSAFSQLRRSLPRLDGEAALPGLAAAASIERDARGVVRISAETELDAVRALGFAHGQDRFFQMDLARRASAGEMSALLGRMAAAYDRQRRWHRFRHRAEEIMAALPAEEQAVLAAYAEGVNAALAGLRARPPEYLLLRTRPERWVPADSLLVGFSMYLDLQDGYGFLERRRALVRRLMTPEVAAFFLDHPAAFEKPLDGSRLPEPPLPRAEHFPHLERGGGDLLPVDAPEESGLPGSNAWTAGPEATADGRAWLANDIHLPTSVPGIWYRATVGYTATDGRPVEVHGATMPGVPVFVAGSNGRLAWGVTNAPVAHLRLLEIEAAGDGRWRLAGGIGDAFALERHEETITWKDGSSDTLVIEETPYGPVFPLTERAEETETKPVVHWVAHRPGALSLGLRRLETAASVEEAVRARTMMRNTALNLHLADRDGATAWALIGRVLGPEAPGEPPIILDPKELPLVRDPGDGIIWNANHRMLGGAAHERTGEHRYADDSRAVRIHRRLTETAPHTRATFASLQWDEVSLLIARWHRLAREVAEKLGEEDRALALSLLEAPEGRAAAASAGYLLVRQFREATHLGVVGRLLAPCYDSDPQFSHRALNVEAPVWRLVQDRPPGLAAEGSDWESELADYLLTALRRWQVRERAVPVRTWGEFNRLQVRHPISSAIPATRRWLDMEDRPLSGDLFTPLVRFRGFQASLRLIVSPGQEAEGLLQTPAGQSGHFLSPFYRSGHRAWLENDHDALLPGPAVHRLELRPEEERG